MSREKTIEYIFIKHIFFLIIFDLTRNQLVERQEVKAQVSLLFKDEKENEVLCCRSLNGTATGKGKGNSTISQKSIDGVFSVRRPNGEVKDGIYTLIL
jgi:hypothetical protein